MNVRHVVTPSTVLNLHVPFGRAIKSGVTLHAEGNKYSNATLYAAASEAPPLLAYYAAAIAPAAAVAANVVVVVVVAAAAAVYSQFGY